MRRYFSEHYNPRILTIITVNTTEEFAKYSKLVILPAIYPITHFRRPQI